MYDCKCGRQINLTSEQWDKIAKNYQILQEETVKCVCGEVLHVCTEPEMFEDHWHVCALIFKSDLEKENM